MAWLCRRITSAIPTIPIYIYIIIIIEAYTGVTELLYRCVKSFARKRYGRYGTNDYMAMYSRGLVPYLCGIPCTTPFADHPTLVDMEDLTRLPLWWDDLEYGKEG